MAFWFRKKQGRVRRAELALSTQGFNTPPKKKLARILRKFLTKQEVEAGLSLADHLPWVEPFYFSTAEDARKAVEKIGNIKHRITECRVWLTDQGEFRDLESMLAWCEHCEEVPHYFEVDYGFDKRGNSALRIWCEDCHGWSDFPQIQELSNKEIEKHVRKTQRKAA